MTTTYTVTTYHGDNRVQTETFFDEVNADIHASKCADHAADLKVRYRVTVNGDVRFASIP